VDNRFGRAGLHFTMLFHKANDCGGRHPHALGSSSCQEILRAPPRHLYTRMIALWKCRTVLRSEIEKQDLHPINNALRQQAMKGCRGPLTLAANNENRRELRSLQSFLLIERCSHEVQDIVLQADARPQCFAI
jgi:hypothetical protein